MFDNIGGQLKTIAKVLTWTGITISIILGIVIVFAGWRILGMVGVVIGCLIVVIGCLASWMGSLFMYGFGELIESNQEMENHLINMNTYRGAYPMIPPLQNPQCRPMAQTPGYGPNTAQKSAPNTQPANGQNMPPRDVQSPLSEYGQNPTQGKNQNTQDK